MLILVFLVLLEGVARSYDYFSPVCDVLAAEPYKDYQLKNQICSDMKTSSKSELDELIGYRVLSPNQHSDTRDINNYGYRGNEITKDKPGETTRIFVVGGSTVLGLRSPENGTIPYYLEQNLKNNLNSNNIEVINAGKSGIESSQELLLIKHRILEFNPDMIVVYDGANDLYHPFDYKPGVILNSTKNSFVHQFKNFHEEYFPYYETVNMFYDLDSNPANPFAKKTFDESKMEEKIQRWENNIIEICEIGNQENIKTIYALQPILGTGNKILTNQEMKFYRFWDHEKMIPHYSEFSSRLDNFESYCDDVLDLRDVFDEYEEGIYMDGVHVGFFGNKVIAQSLEPMVRQVLEE